MTSSWSTVVTAYTIVFSGLKARVRRIHMITGSVIALLGTFVFASVCACFVFQFVAGPLPTRSERIRVTVLSLGLGPLLLAYLLTAYLTVFPGGTRELAIASTLVSLLILASLAYWSQRRTNSAWHDMRWTLAHLFSVRRLNVVSIIGLLVLLFVAGLIVFVAMVVPLTDNDALEYAGSAKLVFEEMSAQRYPFVRLTDSDDYYGPWSHPMGYVALQTWGFMLQGDLEDTSPIRLITPWFAICTAIALVHAIGGIRRTLAPWGAVLLLATPAYLFTTMQSHIDQIRIFSLVAAVLCVPILCRQPNWRRVAGLGCVLGSGIFAHSLGILSCLLISALVFLSLQTGFWKRVAISSAVSLIALLLVSARLIDNVVIFGSPIADVGAVPVYAISQLDWEAYFREARGIATFADQWLAGFFAGLSQPRLYGITYWLFVVALGVFILKLRRSGVLTLNQGLPSRALCMISSTRLEWSSLLVVLMFDFMVFVSVVLDMDSFIKNYRYMMTTLPLVVIFIVKTMSPPLDNWLRSVTPQGRRVS